MTTIPRVLARFTRVDGFPAVLDFAFQSVVTDVVGRGKADRRCWPSSSTPTSTMRAGPRRRCSCRPSSATTTWAGSATSSKAPTPTSRTPNCWPASTLAHALMMFTRGVPTLYYGDEQGFAGDGGYGGARQDMFATQVADYADDRIIGGRSDPFDTEAPLYKAISEMAAPARRSTRPCDAAVSSSAFAGDGPGLFAVSRFDEQGDGETLIVFNTTYRAGHRPGRGRTELDRLERLARRLRTRRLSARQSARDRAGPRLHDLPFGRCALNIQVLTIPVVDAADQHRMVARRGPVSGLSAQLRRHQRRRHRRPAGHHGASGSYRLPRRGRRSGCRPSSPRR